jgi:transposase
MKHYQNKEWLETAYVTNGRSYSDIAKQCGVSVSTIQKAMEKFEISARKQSETAWYTREGIDPNALAVLYGTMSISAIADRFGVSYTAVYRLFVRWGISRRNHGAGIRERNHSWKGGKTKNLNGGYAGRMVPGHHLANNRGYVMEHVLVMEEKLGRPLKKGEVVHHVNEDKQDNRPENLVLFSSKSEHVRHHNPPGIGVARPHKPS